jgi:hypothetical protein
MRLHELQAVPAAERSGGLTARLTSGKRLIDLDMCHHSTVVRNWAVDMRIFTAEQISLAEVDLDGGALYAVDVPGMARPGRVHVNARRRRSSETESWIAEELNRRIARFGVEIVEAALSTPLELE